MFYYGVQLKYDILNEITETRTGCGFRENMIQVANRPCDEVALEWPICLHLESLIQDVLIHIHRGDSFEGLGSIKFQTYR